MQNSRTFWVGVVVVVVLGALVYWWASSGLPLSTWTGLGERNATSTAATSTDTTNTGTQVTGTGSGSNAGGSTINTSDKDVASIVASLPNASQFKSLFASTGVGATINPKSVSKYTIFVPTDSSIAQLAPGTISGLSAAEKKRLIQYHVISGRAIDTEALTAGQVTALSGDPLNFNFGANGIPMVNSAIIITQYNGTNGTVYVIDNVLLPPKKAN